MSKTVIIPDIHHKVDRAEQIIKAELPDTVVFSGDFFDSKPKNYFEDFSFSINTANWIRKIIENPQGIEYKFIEGNHDAPYRRNGHFLFMCDGYSSLKDKEIKLILNKDHWNYFKRYHWVGDYLVSHAGVSRHHLPDLFRYTKKVFNKEEMSKWLEAQVEESEKFILENKPHWVFGVGKSRGGWAAIGGMNWCDFRDEFEPINGIKQIMGHTAAKNVRASANEDLCIDTFLNHYAVITDNGKPEIKAYIDL